MKRIILFMALCLPFFSTADEGMWLVSDFGEIYPKMQKAGLKVGAEELYKEGAPSISDAIVAVDGGMGTGSMISPEGLMITNHHVAYRDIHNLSTPEKNYLEDGFWALDRKDEIPIKGKTVTFLRKVVDVTDEAKAIYDSLKEAGRLGLFTSRRIYSILEKKYESQTPYTPSCSSFFRGELYLLFFYDIYTDVRLVGAPPEKIGAFGGETDNWGWPQHKGDFALYRVYGDKDGKPADYSESNVPIKPVKYLKISTSGVQDGDYAMILGFPGRTNRYTSSFAVENKRTVTNPVVIKARRDLLDVMLAHMEADPQVRLNYSDKYFGISNYADYARWENICLRRYDVADVRAEEEKALQRWIDASPERIEKYGNLLSDLKTGYAARAELNRERAYYQENWIRSSELLTSANRFAMMVANMKRKGVKTVTAGDSTFMSVASNTKRIYSTMSTALERDAFLKQAPAFVENVPPSLRGKVLNEMLERFGGDVRAMLTWAVDNSIITSREAIDKFFSVPRTGEEILADPMIALASSVSVTGFQAKEKEIEDKLGFDVASRDASYARALYAMRKDEGIAQYPDANSTMRITYGVVGPLSVRDATHYDFRSTVQGYMEKYDPDDFEFRVDDRMRSLIKAGDWGRWGENGRLYVNFLTNNDITGGNSGSPVLNARGDIIGLAFDGNRESMAGDTYYQPECFKTVNVDIRFVMWLMDKYAGAQKLIDEMTLVK